MEFLYQQVYQGIIYENTIWAVSFVAGVLSDVSYPMPTISALQWWFQWQGFGEFD
jgi:hypothetical protein